MKIVCLCQGGNSRSAGCAYILKYEYGFDALACGWEGNRKETLEMLFKWADAVFIMETKFSEHVPEEFHRKMYPVDVGPDIWCNSLHPDLLKLCREILGKVLVPVQDKR